jgi:hypothetical protein
MMNVIESLPEGARQIVADIVGIKDAELLAALLARDEPTRWEREAVEDILSTEFCNHLRSDYEPTEYGRAIDNALGAFLTRWPIERERPYPS